MQYTPSNAEAVVAGRKALSHRLWREGDYLWQWRPPEATVYGWRHGNQDCEFARYCTGRVEAVQPGRGKRGIGYQRTTSIHGPHPIQEITEEECLREGIESIPYLAGGLNKVGYRNSLGFSLFSSALAAFAALWDSIYGGQKGKDWESNPMVWGIGVEYVGKERPK